VILLLCVVGLLSLIGGACWVLVMPGPSQATPPSLQETDDQALDRLVDEDPAEALIRFGMEEDAERLIEQGIDLEALGYRPPPGS
jgi:hypothetical protein